MSNHKVKVLFVCMGNICRSPTAEGVFRKLVEDRGLSHLIATDSAGTHAYHIGEQPDRRSQQAALKRDVTMDDLRARKVDESDFDRFDYILAMDRDNFRNLDEIEQRIGSTASKLQLFMEYAPHHSGMEVPDPYYGGPSGFETVLDMIEAASEGLLAEIEKRHL